MSGDIDSATADVAVAQPDATVVKGYGVRNARVEKAPAEIIHFLIDGGYIDGEIAQPLEYGEVMPVMEEVVAVFDAACGDCQSTLGTSVMVAKRSCDGTEDCNLDVKLQITNSRESSSTIYVVVL